jgi:hypothetical protein
MSEIERSTSWLAPTSTSRAARLQELRTWQALDRVERQTVLRTAVVQGEAIVASEKLKELDRLTETAMVGQAMLAKWRETLAGPDPMLQDELRFFSDVARLGKGEILVDTLSAFRRQ